MELLDPKSSHQGGVEDVGPGFNFKEEYELIEVQLPDGPLLNASTLRIMSAAGQLPVGTRVISVEDEKALEAAQTKAQRKGSMLLQDMFPPNVDADRLKAAISLKPKRELVSFFKFKNECLMLCSDNTLWCKSGVGGGWARIDPDNFPPIPQGE